MTDTQTDWRSMVQNVDAVAQAAQQKVAASSIAWVAEVSIVYSSAVSLKFEPRTKVFKASDAASLASAKPKDRVYVHRNGQPTLGGLNLIGGIMIEATGYVPVDGSVEVYHVIPAVALGQSLIIPLLLIGYRAASV